MERRTKRGLVGFLFWMFLETGAGILKENILAFGQGEVMKNILANHRSAITSLILALPLGLTYVILMFNVEPLASVLNDLFTVESQPGEMQLNWLGRIVILGGLLLLPVAFGLSLQPLWKPAGPEGKRRLATINIIIGSIILFLIAVTWGGLIVEEIYCLQGIRCD